MKGKSLAWIFSAALAGTGLSGMAQAQEQFVTIGTGGQTGVYYVAGQSICRFVNRNAEDLKCNAPASGGGVANVNGLRSGEFNFGIMQSDHQYKAMEGLEPFKSEGKVLKQAGWLEVHGKEVQEDDEANLVAVAGEPPAAKVEAITCPVLATSVAVVPLLHLTFNCRFVATAPDAHPYREKI